MKEAMIHIVCCTDSGYVMPTGVMLKSLCINNADTPLHLHIIVDNSVTDTQQMQMKEVLNPHDSISFYNVGKIQCEFPQIGVTNLHVTVASYYRLFLTQLLPDEVEKVIYLDGDIIVRGNLLDLWNFDISDVALAAVKDMDERMNLLRVAYPVEYGYFNAGVLLVNLDYWRCHQLLGVFTDFMKHHSELIVYHDQDVLNYTLYKQKKWLPFIYNAQNGFFFKSKYQLFDLNGHEEDLKEVLHNPIIVHFTLGKPWLKYTSNPYRKDFWYYLRMTPWRKYRSVIYRKKGESWFNMLKTNLKTWLKYQ